MLRIPAALLAEAHLAAGDDDDGRLGVRLAHLVPPVVVAALAEVSLAAVHRARRALRPAAAAGAGARALHRARGGTAAAAALADTGSTPAS